MIGIDLAISIVHYIGVNLFDFVFILVSHDLHANNAWNCTVFIVSGFISLFLQQFTLKIPGKSLGCALVWGLFCKLTL